METRYSSESFLGTRTCVKESLERSIGPSSCRCARAAILRAVRIPGWVLCSPGYAGNIFQRDKKLLFYVEHKGQGARRPPHVTHRACAVGDLLAIRFTQDGASPMKRQLC